MTAKKLLKTPPLPPVKKVIKPGKKAVSKKSSRRGAGTPRAVKGGIKQSAAAKKAVARASASTAGPRRGPLLNPQHEAFVRALLREPNATRAAIVAGYSPASAHVAASRLLKHDNICRRIGELMTRAADRACLRKRDALVMLGQMASGNASNFVEHLGTMDDFRKFLTTAPNSASIRKIKPLRTTRVLYDASGPRVEVIDLGVEIELENRVAALRELAQQMGWYAPQKIETTDPRFEKMFTAIESAGLRPPGAGGDGGEVDE